MGIVGNSYFVGGNPSLTDKVVVGPVLTQCWGSRTASMAVGSPGFVGNSWVAEGQTTCLGSSGCTVVAAVVAAGTLDFVVVV